MFSDRNFEIRPEYRDPQDPGAPILTPHRVFRVIMGSILTGFVMLVCWSIYHKEATWRFSETMNPKPSTSISPRTERQESKATNLSLPNPQNQSGGDYQRQNGTETQGADPRSAPAFLSQFEEEHAYEQPMEDRAPGNAGELSESFQPLPERGPDRVYGTSSIQGGSVSDQCAGVSITVPASGAGSIYESSSGNASLDQRQPTVLHPGQCMESGGFNICLMCRSSN
jgi:hypothetical protein